MTTETKFDPFAQQKAFAEANRAAEERSERAAVLAAIARLEAKVDSLLALKKNKRED